MKTICGFYAQPDVYRDRALMWAEVGRLCGRFELMTGRLARDEALVQAQGPHFALLPVASRDLGGVPLHLAAFAALERRLRAGGVQLVHGTLGFWTLAFLLRTKAFDQIPLLASTFDTAYDLRQMWSPWPGLRKAVADVRFFMQGCLEAQLVQGYTVFGEGHRAPLAQAYKIPLERVHAVPNCVDGAVFFPRARQTVHRRPRALFSAHLTAQKGLLELLEALRRVPELELWLVGRFASHDQAQVKRALAALGDRVKVLGFVPRPKLPELLAEVDFLVHPSHQEGSPRSVIEAMACGLPAILRALPGTLDLDLQRSWAWFAESASSEVWAQLLQAALEAGPREWRERGAEARAVYLRRHSIEGAARAWAALYAKFL